MTADHPQLLRGSRWNADRQGDMTQLPAGRLRNCSVAGKRAGQRVSFSHRRWSYDPDWCPSSTFPEEPSCPT